MHVTNYYSIRLTLLSLFQLVLFMSKPEVENLLGIHKSQMLKETEPKTDEGSMELKLQIERGGDLYPMENFESNIQRDPSNMTLDKITKGRKRDVGDTITIVLDRNKGIYSLDGKSRSST